MNQKSLDKNKHMTLKQQILKLLEKNTDPDFSTTDYDAFAVDVIKLVYGKKRQKKAH